MMKMKMAVFFWQKTDYLCFYTSYKVMFGVKIRRLEVSESIHVGLKLILTYLPKETAILAFTAVL